MSIETQCQKAYKVSGILGNASSLLKNVAFEKMAGAILAHQDLILQANQKDIELGKQNGLSAALLDRLALNERRIQDISDSFLTVKDLADPVGEMMAGWTRPNGLRISKVRVPLGVIGIIYEARPNVTADAIGLCIKTGNCVVLRGSSSAYHSNKAIADTLKTALRETGLPEDAIQLLEDTSRDSVKEFLTMNRYLSVVIPRGGAGLIQTVVQSATVPTIETGVGNCHVYVDESANLKSALDIILNAKVQRPSVCNACETLLVHQKVAGDFLPKAIQALQEQKVEIRGCTKTKALVSSVKLATEDDWKTEFLDLILAVKVVDSLEEAIAHINTYGSKHTEAIVSENVSAINQFKQHIDAAVVMVNASTRFTDGGEFGFGAEMGISTQKLHARGPMGLAELTTYKYIVEGNGHIRK